MKRLQDRIDFRICRPIIGIPLFLLVMYTVFHLSFYGLGAWMAKIMESIFFHLTESMRTWLTSLGTDEKALSLFIGVMSDIASVLSFLPQTAIFFFLIQWLTDLGYLSRAVFVTDTLLCRFGLSGNALIPLALGCGCTVPAILASDELKPNERKALLFSLPFLLCNARLPVLFFLTEAFFPNHKALAAFSCYLLSVFTVLLSSLLSSVGTKAPALIVRLTDYQLPSIVKPLQEAKKKSLDYLRRTAGVIVLGCVCVRLASALNVCFRFTENKKESLLFLLGKLFSFLFAPLGFAEAPFSAALGVGFFAKENLLFVLKMLSQSEISASLSIPARISFTAFSMLYLPCFSSVSVMRREARNRQTSLFLLRTFTLAYVLSWFLYTLSSILVTIVKF